MCDSSLILDVNEKLKAFVSRMCESQVKELKNSHLKSKPVLAFIEVNSGKIFWNKIFAEQINTIRKCGVSVKHIVHQTSVSEQELLDDIRTYNEDSSVHGIVVKCPCDAVICRNVIYNAILPSKDVEGVHSINIKRPMFKKPEYLYPCASAAILKLIKFAGSQSNAYEVVIFGYTVESDALYYTLLLQSAIFVTLCKHITPESLLMAQNADFIVSFIDAPNALNEISLKPKAVVIEYYSDYFCSIAMASQLEVEKSALSPSDFLDSSMVYSTNSVLKIASIFIARSTVEAANRLSKPNEWTLKILPLCITQKDLSDIEIARSVEPKDVDVLAKEIGVMNNELNFYGKKIAKLSLSVIERCHSRQPGKYIVVTGINPTPLGEGKSTTTCGLSQALGAHLQKNVIACVRQPSQGPTFGIKGGAAGGGYSQIIPMEEFNLHLTGDIHAVVSANNLLAAQIDARMFHEATQTDQALYRRLLKEREGKKQFSGIQLSRLRKLGIDKTDPDALTEEEIKRFVRLDIDPSTITWNRVIDTNDRFLRKITIGLSPTEKGFSRDTQFDIAVASELMAILALTENMNDLKNRLSKIVVANDVYGNPVTVDDLGVTGALAVLMKHALCPNLMQTLEGTPVLVHAGPFANIAHGNSSVIADQMALKLVGENGFVVTEAGFGSDIGFEKFCHIKCRSSGLSPDVVVLVATIRALKMHGGGPMVTPGLPLPNEYLKENLLLLESGYCNLAHHIKTIKKYGLPVIVAINRFKTDTETELNLITEWCKSDGAYNCVSCEHFSRGGAGAKELAKAVISASKLESQLKFLYHLQDPIKEKIKTIASEVYGAEKVIFSPRAEEMMALFEKQGFGNLPVCMAKTHLSLSDDPSRKGVPTNFNLTIKDVKASIGAGFIYPLVGTISTMPGLPTRPCFYDVQVSDNGVIEGLF